VTRTSDGTETLRRMTETPQYDDTTVCSVREQGTLTLDETPERAVVERGLERAGFEPPSGDGETWIKRRPRVGEDGLVVARATVGDGRLRVEPESVVGVVSLLPGTTLEVEPKVGWEPLVEMVLTVYGLDRAESYFGVPLATVLSDEIDTGRLVALLAINYVRGVRTVRREGLVRDIGFERRAGFEGGGSVDMAATLRERSRDPRPVWIDTDVRYDVPVNAAIHRAGRVLLGLLQRGSRDDHPAIATLQSLVDRAVRRLEDDGVDSSAREIDAYGRLSVADLPRQRHYYRRVLRVSRSVLTGSLLGGGAEDLLVDYAFRTERLFQQYTQRVIETELDALRAVDELGVLDDVTCESEPTLHPFADETTFGHEPDHLLVADEPIAVLDSKYYATGENPLADGDARSRLFAYAHLTGVDHTALLTPGYHAEAYSFRDVSGSVEVVSPGGDGSFACDDYETAVGEYLRRVLCDAFPVLEPLLVAREWVVPLKNPDLGRIGDTDSTFGESVALLVSQIQMDLKLNGEMPDPEALTKGGDRLGRKVKEVLTRVDEATDEPRYPHHRTTCVPVYRTDVEPSAGRDPGENGVLGVLELYLLTEPAEGDGDPSVDTARIEVF